MIDGLAAAVIGVALLVAALTAVSAVRRRRPGRAVVGVIALAELLVAAQVAVAVVLLARGQRPVLPVAEFLGYHLTALLVLPAGYSWSLADRSRYGPAVISVAGLTVAVLVVRLQQIWSGTGG